MLVSLVMTWAMTVLPASFASTSTRQTHGAMVGHRRGQRRPVFGIGEEVTGEAPIVERQCGGRVRDIAQPRRADGAERRGGAPDFCGEHVLASRLENAAQIVAHDLAAEGLAIHVAPDAAVAGRLGLAKDRDLAAVPTRGHGEVLAEDHVMRVGVVRDVENTERHLRPGGIVRIRIGNRRIFRRIRRAVTGQDLENVVPRQIERDFRLIVGDRLARTGRAAPPARAAARTIRRTRQPDRREA